MSSLVLKDDKRMKVEVYDLRLAAGAEQQEPTVAWDGRGSRLDLLRFCEALLPNYGGVDENAVGTALFPSRIWFVNEKREDLFLWLIPSWTFKEPFALQNVECYSFYGPSGRRTLFSVLLR